jgi:DNA invertase Pin-like site-specific DNA recombinase
LSLTTPKGRGFLSFNKITVSFHKENLIFSGASDPMARLLLHMMGAFAEFERTLINERRREGIAAAKKKGKRIGAKPKLSLEQATELRARAKAGEQKTILAKEFGLSRQAVYSYLGSIKGKSLHASPIM